MKKLNICILALICILQVFIGITFANEKMNFHVDEIYSFGLANNTTGTVMTLPQGDLIGQAELNQYVSVDSSHRFDFANVWANQTEDVHPPFYYVLIHTISSLFPGKFVMMGGIGINLFFSIVITLLLFFVSKELPKNNTIAIAVCSAWSISLGNITFIVFIRMYMMLSALMLAIILLHIKYMNQKLNYKFYAGVSILSIAGALTQYYFLIYLFFLCLIFGIYLLSKRHYKDAFLYVLSLGFAGIGAIGIFPGMLYHIFGGYRGEESFQNIGNTSDLTERLVGYIAIINKELFCGLMGLLIPIIFLLLFIYIRKQKKNISLYAVIFSKYNLLVFPSILYFLIVSKISVYITDRYMMPIFPMLLVLVLVTILQLSSYLFHKREVIALLAVCLILISGIGLIQNKNIEYLYQDTLPSIEFAKEHKDADVLVIYSGAWRLNSVYEELIQYNQLRAITKKKLANFEDIIDNYNDAIVYIIGNDIPTTLETLLSMNTNWSSYTLVNSSTYSHVYYLRSQYEE